MNPPVLSFATGRLTEAGGAEAPWPSLALLGHPVAHSLSPRMHEAALRGLGLEGSYRAIELAPAELGSFVAAAERHGMQGFQLTVPHKETVLEHCTARSPEVERLGAANTLRRIEEGWEAHNTDLPGLVSALRASFPAVSWGGPCAIVGAGGAARACLAALEDLDAGPRRILARDLGHAAWAEERGAELMTLEDATLDDIGLLLQATPLGLHASDPSPIDPSRLPEGCAVMDLCYGEQLPRLLREHQGRGPVADGRAMLLAQAELAFRLWFPGGEPAPYLRAALSS